VSNRNMVPAYRIPMITDVVTAGVASTAIAASRAQTAQAVNLSASFGEMLSPLYKFFTGMATTIEAALAARTLFSMTDAELAARGIKRDDIPHVVWTR
jgi:hypothetical protein